MPRGDRVALLTGAAPPTAPRRKLLEKHYLLFQIAMILAGVAGLYFGGEVMVRSATSLARALRVSPLVIGLTVIAFGTSAPELAAAISAALKGYPDLAVGNVIGSNIANVGLILGVTVLVIPLVAEARFVRREIPFMIGSGALLVPFVLTGMLTRLHAVVLLGLMAVFMVMMLRSGGLSPDEEEDDEGASGTLSALLGSIAGLALLIGGAQLLVNAAVDLARAFGVSERVIGLTVVAFGTSVPELAGCLAAAVKRETGLVLGNVVGSNIFNVLLILPAAILVKPVPVTFAGFGVDLLVMLGFSVVMLFFFEFFKQRKLTRWEGAFFLGSYLSYMAYLAL